ncbi:hypothetical protein ABBQ32_007842 [Trebouxia sp. C0010 RCD-2024]
MPPLPAYTVPAGSTSTAAALHHRSPRQTTPSHSGCRGPASFTSNPRLHSRQRTRLALQSSSSCPVAVHSVSWAPARNQARAKHTSCGSAAAAESTVAPPTVTSLHSSQEFQDVIEHNPGSLIVLMCKAQGCRPCKMFGRKFQRLAEQFQDAIFLDIMGDETSDTRKLMIRLEVKATPTFFLYRDQRLGGTLTGINENNLRNAIIDFGLPSDQDNAPLE